MTKQEAKEQIKKLLEKYQRVKEADKTKSYNEAQTRNEFIEPLFEFLVWDMRNLTTDNEVTTEENVSSGRVNLAFRLNNIPVLFLEAKAMKVDTFGGGGKVLAADPCAWSLRAPDTLCQGRSNPVFVGTEQCSVPTTSLGA